ncbi:MAG: cold-shock protein [Nitrospirae bacterium]|nr:cold-shock protein [Nitrospirota bacterium]
MKRRETGTVKLFDKNKGAGIIKRDKGGEVYVHYSAVLCEGSDCSLKEGNRVKFTICRGPKGPQAQSVVILD